MGPDPLEWQQRGAHPHVGASLRNKRRDVKLEAEDMARADGTWVAADVLQLEQQHSIGPADWVRWHNALRLAVKVKREG